MKLRKKGIRPEPSDLSTLLNNCPECQKKDEEGQLELDEFHSEIACRKCGYVVADSIEYCALNKVNLDFLMIIQKDV
ncbi:hypothetical protein [Methanobacterium sp.]|uniref:hypothetical protein n=1 Tax=Methanobacterium sp. TaxID=2164 RepID=UPI003C735DAC